MLSVMLQGVLTGKPSQRTARNGRPFVVVRLRVVDAEDHVFFARVAAFNDQAASDLLRLACGDAVALVGYASLNHWDEEDDDRRPDMSVTATRVLSVFDVGHAEVSGSVD